MNNQNIFLSRIQHAYSQMDGTYKFPDSREGDMLKRAKREIEKLQEQHKKMCECLEWLSVVICDKHCLICRDRDNEMTCRLLKLYSSKVKQCLKDMEE